MSKRQQTLTNVLDTLRGGRNSIDLKQRCDKCRKAGLQQVWQGRLRLLEAILLLQAAKEASQLFLRGGLTFPDQRGNFRTRKSGGKPKR